MIARGTTTSQSQTANGHRIGVYALSQEGATVTEKDLREIANMLNSKGFSVKFLKRGHNVVAELGALMFG